MRIAHTIVAFGIALLANAIEPEWLGFLFLLLFLAAYAYFAAVRPRRKE